MSYNSANDSVKFESANDPQNCAVTTEPLMSYSSANDSVKFESANDPVC